MSVIFISYRRNDASGHAGRVFDHLANLFGENNIFFDRDSIEIGRNWSADIETNLNKCDIFIAIIGKEWFTDRLNDPEDWVRLEIATALRRKIHVFPVLVSVEIEKFREFPLPKVLQPMMDIQFCRLDDRDQKTYRLNLKDLTNKVASKIERKGKITIYRKGQVSGFPNNYDIYLDDEKLTWVNLIDWKRTLDISIGKHTICANDNFLTSDAGQMSKPITFYLDDQKPLIFECGMEITEWNLGFAYRLQTYIRQIIDPE